MKNKKRIEQGGSRFVTIKSERYLKSILGQTRDKSKKIHAFPLLYYSFIWEFESCECV